MKGKIHITAPGFAHAVLAGYAPYKRTGQREQRLSSPVGQQ
jgi:hypothetical protein